MFGRTGLNPSIMSTSDVLVHLAKDPLLAPHLDEQHWTHTPGSTDVYERLLRAICGQQLSVKAASTIWGRVQAHFGDSVPPPAELLDVETDTLRSLGLSRQKASYLHHVAAFFVEHPTDKAHWQTQSDEEVLRALTSIKGVGVWTVEMLLIFTLHRPDVLPLGDLGVQQGMALLYDLPETGKELKRRMTEIAEAWRPYRSFASRSIWRYKDAAKRKSA